ncbi:uncharacterized protein LOC120346201 [Styela clava]
MIDMNIPVILVVGTCCLLGSAEKDLLSLRSIVSEEYYKVVKFSKLVDQSNNNIEGKLSDFPFQNTSLSFNERVDDLVNRLTLDELVEQLSMGGANIDGPAPAISRLNVKPYQWNTECLRGYAFADDATCFPSPIGLAATFDPSLIENMARAVSWEARAKVNNFESHGKYEDHTGLSCFSPVINIMRHPLWGRNQETYGEDPFLTGIFAKHYVEGLQGYNDRYAAATAVCKHFDVHGGPENNPNRFGFNAVVSDRDWQMTHLPAFRACIEAGAYGVMCSYNAINGVPACANKKLLTDILRNELGFTGYVVSDEGAIEHIDLFFNYTSNSTETAIAAITAGVNLELTYVGPLNRFFKLKNAVDQKMIDEDLLRERAKPLFYTRFKLGQFDPPSMNPYANVSMDVIQSPEHRELAYTITAKSFVLLKNNGVLPLKETFDRVAIVGPFANNSIALTGDYPAQFSMIHFSSPYDGIQKFSTNTATILKGCTGDKWDEKLPKCAQYSEQDIKTKIPGSDVVIVTLGTGVGVEAEGIDRTGISLPGEQLNLLKSVVQYAGKSARIIVLLFNAGPLDVSWAKESAEVDAIIACHFPAQSAGEAIYRVLSGQENPAGRLPNTWPKSLDQVPPITNYSMHERTYRYSTSEPLYSFGYGLSYTTFLYRGLIVGGSGFDVCDDVGISVSLTNTGKYYGEEVAQLYIKWLNSTVTTPHLQLVGFKRIGIKPGQTVNVHFTIKPEQRAVWIDDLMLKPGKMFVYLGGQQPSQSTLTSSDVLTEEFTVSGQTIPLSKCSFKTP